MSLFEHMSVWLPCGSLSFEMHIILSESTTKSFWNILLQWMNSTQKPSKMELKHTSGSIIFLLILVQSSVSGGLNCEFINIKSKSGRFILIFFFEFLVTEYYEMPKMYKYEPYDQCLNAMAQHEAVYCMVNAVIAPNSSNPTWNIIQVCIDRRRSLFNFHQP